MEVVDFLLDGLEKALELERELGVRFVECDRGLLDKTPNLPNLPNLPNHPYDFVFLHDRPLSDAGRGMMEKIVAALGKTALSAPIVIEKPVPMAKTYVVLGGRALAKFQPKLKGAPGQWLTTERGARVLVTYSPEYILRFKEVTDAVKKIKEDMWRSLKALKKGDS